MIKMKKNKWYIYFSCLLIAFMLFVSVGVTVNANSSSLEGSFIDNDNVVDFDYNKTYSRKQPYVLNYYYIDNQDLPTLNIYNPYIFTFGSTDIFSNVQFDYQYDAVYQDSILYNETNIAVAGGYGSFGSPFVVGYCDTLYTRVNDFNNSLHTITFNGVSLPMYVNYYFNIDYIVSREINSYEVVNYDGEGVYIDSIYTDDDISLNDVRLWQNIFDEDTPYEVNNTLIRINYLYYEFVIDWTDYLGEQYFIDYVYPIMEYSEYSNQSNFINVWDNYDFSFNPPDIDIDFGQSLLDSVNSFMQFEILPNFNLFNLLMVVIAVPMLIYILKLFLGG